MRRPIMIAAAAAAVLVAGFAAAATLANGSTAKTDSGGTLVKLHKTALGNVLVDSRGRTLYLFEGDHGRTSSCKGKCAAFWPPLTTSGKPRAAAGVRAALLGTTRRSGTVRQVTYHGHPLYRFVKDARAGQVNGQNVDAFGAEWYVVSAAGQKIEREVHHGSSEPPATTTTTTTTDDSGGGGGGYGAGGGYGY